MTNIQQEETAVKVTRGILSALEGQEGFTANEKVIRAITNAIYNLPANFFEALVELLISAGYIAREGENLKSLRMS